MSPVNGLKHVQLLILSPGKWGVSPFGCLEPKVRTATNLEKHINLNGFLKIRYRNQIAAGFGLVFRNMFILVYLYQTRLESGFKFCFSLFTNTPLKFYDPATHTVGYTIWGLKSM